MATHKPARAVIRRSPHRDVGVITVPWLQEESIEWESQLERRGAFACIAFFGTVKILHQPFHIPLKARDGKSEARYTPDFLVELIDGTKIVIEVKPRRFVEENESLFNEASGWLGQNGIVFAVLTDQELDHPGWRHVEPMLLQYARWDIDAESRARIFARLVDAGGRLLFRDLWDGINVKTKIPALHMLGRREILCDPRCWREDDTEIKLPANKCQHKFQPEKSHENEADAAYLFFDWLGVAPWDEHAKFR